MSAPNDKNTPEACTFAYFLESVPPGTKRAISDLFLISSGSWILGIPDIELHCSIETCRGVRIFGCGGVPYAPARGDSRNLFFTYTCRNCKTGFKTYALLVFREQDDVGSAVKYGEIPPFGPPLSARLLKMAGADGDLLRKGRRAENQSLGIGAFVYYRRVVENQKDQLLKDIHKAAVRLGAGEELLDSIDRAIQETRFSEALKLVKDAIPDGLKVKGHNPLMLLHKALSKGVHEQNDEECLERAQLIRDVLDRLVANIVRVAKEEREFDDAVKKLLSAE